MTTRALPTGEEGRLVVRIAMSARGGMTMEHHSQESLLAEAASALGGEQVLAASVFALEEMIGVALVGATLGGAIGAAAGGSVQGMSSVGKPFAGSADTSVQQVVAVTAQRIHVLNRESDGHPPTIVETFDRSTCRIEVSHFGATTFFRLTEPGADKDMKLGATILSGPDRHVMNLLTG